MLRNNTLITILLFFISTCLLSQNSSQNYRYRNDYFTIQIEAPVKFSLNSSNFVNIHLQNISDDNLFVDTLFTLGIGNDYLLFDNTYQTGIETIVNMIKIKPNKELSFKILLNTEKITKYFIKYFSIHFDFGYLTSIDKCLVQSERFKRNDNSINISSGLAFMMMKRKYLICCLVEVGEGI
ncbi:MAG: hypothetical protein K9H48_12280 [Melioribacteraceae bacterium]|nr:hypothetical protein [Melioribacteraceae bacterium]MCF8395080.1 hypothetical protein [Melioribacteraceae bacterium]MCF8420373.1 hypothetical protein [Melioribacteraceae bacterium]